MEHKVQGDPGGNVNILGGDSIGHCEETELIRTSLDVYRERAVWISRADILTISVCWDWMRSDVYKSKANTPDEFLANILDAVDA